MNGNALSSPFSQRSLDEPCLYHKKISLTPDFGYFFSLSLSMCTSRKTSKQIPKMMGLGKGGLLEYMAHFFVSIRYIDFRGVDIIMTSQPTPM